MKPPITPNTACFEVTPLRRNQATHLKGQVELPLLWGHRGPGNRGVPVNL